MVELMVALVLSLLVSLAAVSALLVSRQGFTSVDAVSQLRDNARFATDFISRLAVQSGFKDVTYAAATRTSSFIVSGVSTNPEPNIYGFNDSLLPTSGDPLAALNGSRSTNCIGPDATNTACANGSDILVLRYQSAGNRTSSGIASSDVDGAMFNCMGVPLKLTPDSSSNRIVSILHVAVSSNGEPALMCKYQTDDGSSWETASQPLVEGVESFQVLYGTDGVVPSTAPVANSADSVADRYLRADELSVAGDTIATYANWKRVRSLRIGLIMRGPINSAQDTSAATIQKKLYPLGSDMYSASDAKSEFTPNSDGRLRQTVIFTVYLHNAQDL